MYEYIGIVTRVVDGDTIDITIDFGFKVYHNVRVRLKDVDTPEMFGKRAGQEYERGVAAKEFVESLILKKVVRVNTHKDRTGKYGRYIAVISWEDEDGTRKILSEEIKKAGHEK